MKYILRQVIFTVTLADPQIFVKMAGLLDLTCNYPDRSIPRDCLRRYERYSATNVISSNDFSKARNRNKLWPITTHLYVYSTIQYVSVNMGRPALSAWLVRLLQRQYSIHMKEAHEFTRKKRYETECTTQAVNLIMQASSEWALAKKAAKWSIEYGCVIHLLHYICGKT